MILLVWLAYFSVLLFNRKRGKKKRKRKG
uniref:Uncharacterized protein n=1 Tax=Rhizophora mucronata TaxID=61149 RepID=A0A2P2NVE1_RHIMU